MENNIKTHHCGNCAKNSDEKDLKLKKGKKACPNCGSDEVKKVVLYNSCDIGESIRPIYNQIKNIFINDTHKLRLKMLEGDGFFFWTRHPEAKKLKLRGEGADFLEITFGHNSATGLAWLYLGHPDGPNLVTASLKTFFDPKNRKEPFEQKALLKDLKPFITAFNKACKKHKVKGL